MPLMVIMCVMTRPQSMGKGSFGSPSIATRPPWFMWASMSSTALGTPDISRPTSKPSFIPRVAIASPRSEVRALTTRSAPASLASSSR